MTNIDRRAFLKLIGAGGFGTGAGFLLAETTKHPVAHLIPHPIAPEEWSPGIAVWYNTVCSMCPAGCGISVRTREGRPKKIEGNPLHPVSQGRLCARGQAGLQTLYNPDRLTNPLELAIGAARGSGAFVPAAWSEGLQRIGTELTALRADGRAGEIAFLTAGMRGHVAELIERFMTALGSPRLLHYDFGHPTTLYAANERVFGERHLPYYDISNTNYLISFGADFLGGWISPVHHSQGYGHSRQGRPGLRAHTVQIEPRMSLSGAAADQWIPARPGTEGLIALALAHEVVASGRYAGEDRQAWLTALAPYEPAQVASQADVPAAQLAGIAQAFAASEPGLAIGGGSAGAHTNGVDTLVAVNVLNYLAGNIGREGGIVLNPAPAFGPSDVSRRAELRELEELAAAARDGRIAALIVSGGANPVFTLPAALEFEEALAHIPLIVSLSSFMDETTAFADMILPGHTYLESWSDDCPEPGVGFSVGAIAQPVVAPLYDTRATGDIVLGLARAAGLEQALPWTDTEAFLRTRWQEIYARGLAAPAQVDQQADEDDEPSVEAESVQDIPDGPQPEDFESFWRSVLVAGVWGENRRRQATGLSVDPALISDIAAAEFDGPDDAYPFMLHPYLMIGLDDGRGANLPWLQQLPDPLTSVVYGSWIELNPLTASTLGVAEGDVVEVESAYGRLLAPVYIYPAIRPDVIAIPIGQGHTQYGRYAQDRGVNPLRMLAPLVEQTTGSLAWSATRVRLTRTGRRITLVKTGAVKRELGRDIVQRTAASAADSSPP